MTSQATSRSTLARRGSMSSRATRRPSSTTPSSRSMPAPPSFVALPPMPRAMCRTPSSRTARRRSPVPRVSAPSGSRSDGVRRDRPDASASSTMALEPSARLSQRADTSRPIGSWARDSRQRPAAAAAIAASVPSPPSASGARVRSVVGSSRAPAGREGLGDLDRRERALERVRRDEDVTSAIRHSAPTGRSSARASPHAPPARVARGTPGSGSSAAAPGRPAR